ncbi:MAG: 30S ribosomal protein S5 [Rickettsiales bacterium]|nr:MAG: 30S ribosomal protein S5 [Rickettsiales bacterium]
MQNKEDEEFIEILIAINRVAKVVKGGRRFGFAAVVVVGNRKGKVGCGLGKAKEVMEARTKAIQVAKRNMRRVYLKEGRTLHHDIIGHYGAGQVLIRSAKPGTGIIAGGPMRAIFYALGIHDVVAKSIGSSNVHNVVHATFNALENLSSPKYIAEKRSKKISEIIDRRERGDNKKDD